MCVLMTLDYRWMVLRRRRLKFPVIQWLGLHTFTAEGPVSIPGQRTKISQAVQHGQKKKKEGFGSRRQILEQSPFLQFLACSASQHRLEEWGSIIWPLLFSPWPMPLVSCNMEANFCMKDKKKKYFCSVIDLGVQRNKKELRYVLDW